jgi:hypothetical protein
MTKSISMMVHAMTNRNSTTIAAKPYLRGGALTKQTSTRKSAPHWMLGRLFGTTVAHLPLKTALLIRHTIEAEQLEFVAKRQNHEI